MDESDKKAIEGQLVLRERILALKKKQQELHKETWHKVSLFFSTLIVFALCGLVIFIGARDFPTLPKDNSSNQAQYSLFWNGKSWYEGRVHFQKPDDANDRFLPHTDLAVRSLLILSGLGVAALFAIRLAKNNDES